MEPQFIKSFDGTELAVHRIGEGRPVILLHGLFSSADMNWIKFGHAQQLADAGFEAIMPDLRAHGDSGAPHEPEAYPSDVLVRDVKALVEALELDDFDLVGFSLGARTAVASVIAGVAPRRLIMAGMGIKGLSNWDRRAAFFIDAIDRYDEVKQGDKAFFAVQFMKSMKIDRVAARLLLTGEKDIALDDLAAVTCPTLVLCGADDRDNGSPQDIASALPDARYVEILGSHMSSVTMPDMGEEIVRFLAG